MTVQFPPEFRRHFKDPATKAAWVSHYDGPDLTHCTNCNGSGFFVATIAIAGPFDSPPNLSVTGHWHDNRWWIVKNVVAECPVCHNVRQRPAKREYVPMPDETRRKLGEFMGRRNNIVPADDD